MEKICCECKTKYNLLKLESGKFVCINCLDEIGKEQKEIRDNITEYLKCDYNIVSPANQAKLLEAIAMEIRFENNLLNKDETEKLKKVASEMDRVRDNYNKYLERVKNGVNKK